MKQCPRCGYMNDDVAKYCINCGYILDSSEQKQKNSGYKKTKIIVPAALAIVIALGLIIALPTISALINPSVVPLSASDAQSIFGGTWSVITNETFLKQYPEENVTIEYANGTTIQIPFHHYIKSLDHEVMIGNVSGVETYLVINIIHTTSNVTFGFPGIHNSFMMFGHFWHRWNTQFSFNETTYNGYSIYYLASNIPHPHTEFIAIKGNTVIEIIMHNYFASINQMEQVLNDLS
ncbi:zinc-ribbon domain-containing protein [Acidianus sulfidivorans JP7]|uniref:Zinc ribbon domain-containing protein n=1 Tax=Acidianus sulfidivorans JP7 TaxID=619593 RepID=A0A2U9IL75_9CREN|nr:zinc ribbon domain-containing protein [Acidianus sulfidivorans]AWR96745.1 zinc-ribbon domain-containing protein [Acidianus sulfidivorans JP7]